MSNNNAFWGKRFGSILKDGTLGFKIPRGSTNGSSNSGKKKNDAETVQAKKDKKAFIEAGRPTIVVDWRNNRIQ